MQTETCPSCKSLIEVIQNDWGKCPHCGKSYGWECQDYWDEEGDYGDHYDTIIWLDD